LSGATKLSGAILAAGRGERLRPSDPLPKPLVDVGGEPLLARQARAMLAAGARDVTAVVNSETAAAARRHNIELPRELKLVVRDTANSMETLFTLGETLAPGLFLAATVDAVLPPAEFTRFTREALALTASGVADGVLALAPWRGEKRPLFAHVTEARVTEARLISELGDRQSKLVTAGIYLLPARVFELAGKARERKLDALRQFLAMLIAEDVRLGAIEVEGAIDVDEPADLEAARAAAGRFAKAIAKGIDR
jgi:NDP-sugar pyrophosphorylase family protein